MHLGINAQSLSLGGAVGKDLVVAQLNDTIGSYAQTRGLQIKEDQRTFQFQFHRLLVVQEHWHQQHQQLLVLLVL